MITSGSVSSARIGFTIVFAIPRMAAPRMIGHQRPIVTLSKIQSTTSSETMFASQERSR